MARISSLLIAFSALFASAGLGCYKNCGDNVLDLEIEPKALAEARADGEVDGGECVPLCAAAAAESSDDPSDEYGEFESCSEIPGEPDLLRCRYHKYCGVG
jgi:hypothetical protein